MTRAMALDHAVEGIRINAICLGESDTPLVRAIHWTSGGSLEEDAARIPMCRVAEPDEVTTCAAFLASEAASYITGACLSVDGVVDATAGVSLTIRYHQVGVIPSGASSSVTTIPSRNASVRCRLTSAVAIRCHNRCHIALQANHKRRTGYRMRKRRVLKSPVIPAVSVSRLALIS
jgi:hypothetical protein